MLMEVKNNIRYFFNAVKIGIKSAMAYKVSFLVQVIFMVINNFFFLIFWGVIFSNTGESSGITFNNVLYLWSFSTIAYGVTYFFFGGVRKINDYIITGSMDSFLLQPKNILLNVLTSQCNFSAFGDILYGLAVGIAATGGDISKMIILIFLGIFVSVFFISTEIILRSLTVWIGDTKTIANRYVEMLLITFSTYPENIFKTGIKVLLYTVIPVAYLAYLPSNIMYQFNILDLLCVLLAGGIYLVLAIFVFYKAIKNYESGNNMSMKG